jgi:hypothetical protein
VLDWTADFDQTEGEMLTVQDDGLIIIRRADYLHRCGSREQHGFRLMTDGDILAQIQPEAYRDINDAKEIADWISVQLGFIRPPSSWPASEK